MRLDERGRRSPTRTLDLSGVIGCFRPQRLKEDSTPLTDGAEATPNRSSESRIFYAEYFPVRDRFSFDRRGGSREFVFCIWTRMAGFRWRRLENDSFLGRERRLQTSCA